MTIDSLQTMWNSYLGAYKDVSAAERERLLRSVATDDIVFSNPTGDESRGLDKLAEHVSQFQSRNPGGYFVNNSLLSHHGQLLAEWTMHKKDGAKLATGHTYARFDDQGRLTHTAGFWRLP